MAVEPISSVRLRVFWRLSLELRVALRAGDVAEIAEVRDEIDLLALYASPLLRARCQALLNEHKPQAAIA